MLDSDLGGGGEGEVGGCFLVLKTLPYAMYPGHLWNVFMKQLILPVIPVFVKSEQLFCIPGKG